MLVCVDFGMALGARGRGERLMTVVRSYHCDYLRVMGYE